MKNIIILFMALLLAGCAKKEPANYEIATWYGFKQAAISYTFDDQTPKQFTVAIPMLDEFGFKATLYPVVNWGRWDEIKQAAANGHEIGSHTVSHPRLSTLSIADQEMELRDSKAFINEQLSSLRIDCNTIAYPYCDASDLAITAKYYIAARNCATQIAPSTPEDYYNIPAILCGDQGNTQSLEDFRQWFNSAADTNGWCILLFHGIDDDGGYSPVTSEVFRQSLEYLDNKRETYWVTTFRNAVLYAKERDAVSVVEKQCTKSEITIAVTNTLDNTVYNLPLTIRRSLPAGWKKVEVKQNDQVISSDIVTIDQSKYIVFDAIPNRGMVFIKRQ
ncbi:MAG: polysaccharide deacetylase family protein [Dysgonamonadaceae bacterium]|jgi:oligosaccharide reducing-end xylanase|nr:polysaccharide deacetylase family protein [Dysgonamonadaceae bacterium]